MGGIERCGLCKDIIAQVGAVPAESEGRDGEGPEAFVHCNGGCGRKVHAECARRLSLAWGSAADDTAARRGRGAHPDTEPAALPSPTPPVAPDPPAPPAAAPGPNGKGSQAGKRNLDGSYWSAALPAAKRSAAARAAAAEARFEAAARGASAGAVATEAVAAEAVVWQCDRCAALLGRAVYARGVDGFYHRGVAVARDEHGQMQVA